MKLLIVTAVHECKATVADIFHQAGLYKYSVTRIHGVNSEHAESPLGNWFGSPGMKDENESVMLFCFTDNDTAYKTLAALKQYNEHNPSIFPIRALVLPVEESI
jgi:hypothetical protein